MQITVKSTKLLKEGTGTKGDWKLVGVTSSDGTNYATFHKGAENLTAGTVIDIGEPTIKEGKVSFKEYTVVSAPPPPAPGQPSSSQPAKSDMSKEDWAEKQQAERFSIESQTAFKGIIELVSRCFEMSIEVKDMGKLNIAYDAALDWAMTRLNPTTAPAAKPAPATTTATPESTKPKTNSPVLKPMEVIQGYCMTLGWDAIQWHEYLRINFNAGKFGDLTEKQVVVATNNLKALAHAKQAGADAEVFSEEKPIKEREIDSAWKNI